MNKILVFLFSLAFIGLRPMAIGYSFTIESLGYLLFFFCLILISSKNHEITSNNKKIIFWIIITYIPIMITRLMTNLGELNYEFFNVLIVSLIFGKLFSLRGFSNQFYKSLLIIFLAIILSTLVTFGLSFLVDLNALKIASIPIRNRGDFDATNIYFPFSPLYSYFTTEFYAFPRFSFYFIEAGIASGFFSAFFFMDRKFKRSHVRLQSIILFIGGILSFSTSFLPAFGIGYIFRFFSYNKLTAKRIFSILFLLITGIYIFFNLPYIGFLDKSETHGSSFDDRLNAYSFTSANLNRFAILISASILVFRISFYKYRMKDFLTVIAPIFFVGLVNVVFYSPLFIAFCFFDFGILKTLPAHSLLRIKSPWRQIGQI